MPECIIDIESYDPAARFSDKTAITVGRVGKDGVFRVERIEFPKPDQSIEPLLRAMFNQPKKPPLWRRLLRPAAYVVAAVILILLSTGAY